MEAAMTAVLLRLGQVEQATGLKKSAIYAKIKGREFPAAVRLGSRSVAWRSDEIQAWIDGLPKVEQRSSDTCSQRSSKDVWLSRTTALIGGIFKVVSIVKICLDIFNHYQP